MVKKMTRKWTDNDGKLLLYDHIGNSMVPTDKEHKMCPFTLGYCHSTDDVPGVCFKDACELWDPDMKRCSLSDRIRDDSSSMDIKM